jgi:hypothetical protein
MNPAIKAQWVAALRSGYYQQSKHTLRSAVGFCCLGVLCDLAVQQGIASWSEPADEDPIGDKNVIPGVQACITKATDLYEEEVEMGILPVAIQTWASLNRGNPCITFQPDDDKQGDQHFTYLNDILHLSFSKIADLIEAQL